MAGDNTQQRRQWSDAARVKMWAKREPVTATMTAPLLAAIALKPGERVLDVGSGLGVTALGAAPAVGPSGAVVGVDISAPMCEAAAARARDAGVANVGFVACDAQTDTIEGGPFDAVMSQFGVMFFADPVAAFANIRRHIKPGGRLAFICWQSPARNPWHPRRAMAAHTTQPPAGASADTPPPGPFAFADVEYVRRILAQAGFADVRRDPVEHEAVVPEDAVYDRATLDDMRLPPETVEAAWRDLQAMAEKFRESEGFVRLPLAAQLFTARNSG